MIFSVSDPHKPNADAVPDPDPGFYLNADPDLDFGFWILDLDPRPFLPKN